MKKVFILLLLSFPAFCQFQKSGKIYFKETMKLDIQLDEKNKEMAKMFPTSKDSYKVLLYNETESLFLNEEKKDEDLDVKKEEGEVQMRVVFKMPQSTTYLNLKNNEFVQSLELLGKEFLIVDKLNDGSSNKWKITGEQKKVLDFVCQKAILLDTTQKLEVWFTPQIPIAMGPNGSSGLPGMILAAEIDNGKRLLAATSIEAIPENYVFVKPVKGKKVNKEEFKKIREEKLKEMGGNSKGGTRIIIRNEEH